MKALSLVLQVAAVLFLVLIAYNTGVGKTLPVHHAPWMSCNGLLTQNLFYSILLKDNDGMKDLSVQVKSATTVEEINKLVTDGTNIDAARTIWFESVSEPGTCQAQIFLQRPNKDGENAAYVEFEIGGFARADTGFFGTLLGSGVVESLRMSPVGIVWFKE